LLKTAHRFYENTPASPALSGEQGYLGRQKIIPL
jgi:hypothetical protein